MACCATRDIPNGTTYASNSISILPRGFPQPITKVSVKKTISTQYSTDMELDQTERKALNELLLALDTQRPIGFCGCCCTSKKDYKNIMAKIDEMHMAYQLNACCYHVNQVLLTKTGNVTKAKPSTSKATEVPHGVMLFPGETRIVCNHILSEEERGEILQIQRAGSKQCMNASKMETLLICLLTSAYTMGGGCPVTMGVVACMGCCNCRGYKQLRKGVLNTGATRSVSILEEWCCTVNTVEYRNFSFPANHFDPAAVIEMGRMDR